MANQQDPIQDAGTLFAQDTALYDYLDKLGLIPARNRRQKSPLVGESIEESMTPRDDGQGLASHTLRGPASALLRDITGAEAAGPLPRAAPHRRETNLDLPGAGTFRGLPSLFGALAPAAAGEQSYSEYPDGPPLVAPTPNQSIGAEPANQSFATPRPKKNTPQNWASRQNAYQAAPRPSDVADILDELAQIANTPGGQFASAAAKKTADEARVLYETLKAQGAPEAEAARNKQGLSGQLQSLFDPGEPETQPLPLTSSEERGTVPSQNVGDLGPYNPLLGDPIVGGNQPQLQLQPTNPSNTEGRHPPWTIQKRPQQQQQVQQFDQRFAGPPRPFPYQPGGSATAPGRMGMQSNFAREEGEAQALAQPGGRPQFGTAPSGRPVFSASRQPETDTARAYRTQLQQGEQARAAEIERKRKLSAQAPHPQYDLTDIAELVGR